MFLYGLGSKLVDDGQLVEVKEGGGQKEETIYLGIEISSLSLPKLQKDGRETDYSGYYFGKRDRNE